MAETHLPSPLRLARLTRGWRQSDLAAQSGVSVDTISRVELGGLPTLTTAQTLARALGSKLDALFPHSGTTRYRAAELRDLTGSNDEAQPGQAALAPTPADGPGRHASTG